MKVASTVDVKRQLTSTLFSSKSSELLTVIKLLHNVMRELQSSSNGKEGGIS